MHDTVVSRSHFSVNVSRNKSWLSAVDTDLYSRLTSLRLRHVMRTVPDLMKLKPHKSVCHALRRIILHSLF